jgi:hypothetical protein
MHAFKLPAHRRKNAKSNKSPPHTEFNEWAVGRAKVMKLVASIERAGHQTMVARLKSIQRLCAMTPEQAREVRSELVWRSNQVKTLTTCIQNADRTIRFQYSKPGAPSLNSTEQATPMVAGPSGIRPHSKFVQHRMHLSVVASRFAVASSQDVQELGELHGLHAVEDAR